MQITAAYSNSKLNTFREVQYSHYSSQLMIDLTIAEDIGLPELLDGTFTDSKDEQLIAYYCSDEPQTAVDNYYEQTVKTLSTMQHSKQLKDLLSKHKLMLESGVSKTIAIFSFVGTVQQLKDLLDAIE